MIRADLIIENAAEVVTCAAPAGSGADRGPARRHGRAIPPATGPLGRAALAAIPQHEVGAIPGGAIACLADRIVFVGTGESCRGTVSLEPGGTRIDAKGGVVLPGFIDAHTHLPFGGWRVEDFERRLRGATYLEIAAAGGGILSTVRATRALAPEAIATLVRNRLDAMLRSGTTTVEAKSGYGLSLESEIGILSGLALASDHAVEILPTLLGAHVIPPEYAGGRRADYVRLVTDEMIPRASRDKLARSCDVFIDEGAFTLEEGAAILEAAARSGLGLRVHAEQLSRTGAARLGASLGAASVDHLERLTEDDVAELAATWRRPGDEAALEPATPVAGARARGTAAILLPGAAHFLRETARPPARALIEAGVPVAVASDFNPGTSPCHAMPPILGLASLLFGLTPDEAIVGATRAAALSLGVEERAGTLEVAKQADIAVWNVPDRRHLAYRFGPLECAAVVKRGRVVAGA